MSEVVRASSDEQSRNGRALRDHARAVRERATEELEVFEASIRPDGETYKSRIFQSNRLTGKQIAADYGRRFLVELVQNGHDAHAHLERAGRLAVLLASSEGDHGTLYVANGGDSFSFEDFEALCNLGGSNKPPGESIGNKGLGFRSVTHVSDDPQVYSRASSMSSDCFDGYCFHFAQDADLDDLITNPAHLALAKKDLPLFHIPIPLIDAQPRRVRDFAAQGFATVVRLPLKSQEALATTQEEMALLGRGPAPLLLFLRRLASVSVAVEDNSDETYLLTRRSRLVDLSPTGIPEALDRFEIVDLGPAGEFFVAWRTLPHADVLQAISASTELSERWKDWRGDGEVAVAAPLSAIAVTPRLYTHLPMGHAAAAPFNGYLHGSFFPKADRTSLDASIPLNGLCLREALALSVRTVRTLVAATKCSRPLMDDAAAGNLVADLLTWNSVASIGGAEWQNLALSIAEAFGKQGVPLRDADVVPVVPGPSGRRWAKPTDVWQWDHPGLVAFGVDRLVADGGVAIALGCLGKSRLERLRLFFSKLIEGFSLDPNAGDLANVVERLAGALWRAGSDPAVWTQFYVELPTVSRLTNPPVNLGGRLFLLCDDGELHRAHEARATGTGPAAPAKRNRRKASEAQPPVAVFSPPRASDELLAVPPELGRRFAFLDQRLDWNTTLSTTQAFLESGLVRRYDSTELIAQVSNLLTIDPRAVTRRAALRWVFLLFQAGRRVGRPVSLSTARLFVPTSSGNWVIAGEAHFGGGWPPERYGDLLDRFLLRAAPLPDELVQVQEHLVAAKSRVFAGYARELWAEFLGELGVKRGLHPVVKDRSVQELHGTDITPTLIAAQFGLGAPTAQAWRDAPTPNDRYRYWTHRIEKQLWAFPGQDVHSGWDTETRRLYAQLVLAWLPNATTDKMSLVFRVPSYPNASRLDWPSPLGAFLRRGEWIPVEGVRTDVPSKTVFKGGEDVWLGPSRVPALPPYLPQFSRVVHAAWSPELANVLVEHCGANVLNSQASLPRQVGYMGELFADGEVDEYGQRTFLNAYADAWHRLAREFPGWSWASGRRPDHLIVRRRDANEAIRIGTAGQGTVYVRDSDDTSKLSMVSALGEPLFDAGAQSVAALAALVLRLLGTGGRPLSKVPVTLLVDGAPFTGVTSEDPVLAEQSPWLPVLLALAMASQRGAAARRLPLDRGLVIERFQRVRIRFAHSLEFDFEGTCLPIPVEDQGTMPVRDQARPLVLVTALGLDWPTLVRAARPICELIDHSDLAQALMLGIRALQRMNEQVGGPLPVDRALIPLCQELQIRESEGLAALSVLDSNARRLTGLLAPLVHYEGGDEALADFTAASSTASTIHGLRGVLEKVWPSGASMSVDEAIIACQRSRNAADLQQDLRLDFARFNEALIATGVSAITYPELHKQALAAYIERNRDFALDRLRSLAIDQAVPGGDLSRYVESRSLLRQIRPAQQWLVLYQEPPDELMASLLHDWLSAQGASTGTSLAPVSQVLQANRSAVGRLAQRFGRIVGAWCRVHGEPLPQVWTRPESASVAILEALEGRGALEFHELNEEGMVAWLRAIGLWPPAMQATTSLNLLGLTENDLDHERQERERERAAREKHDRSVEFRGRLVDPKEADHSMLSAEVELHLSKAALKVPLGVLATLQPAPERNTAPRGGSGGAGGRRRRVPDEKSDLIGFLGECAVYHWLHKQFPHADIDDAWKSEMRSQVLPGIGVDNLGYDFSIRYRRKTWQLEVKSSVGDPMQFEMGESEVRAAMEAASARDTEYRVIYVSGVIDPAALRIDVLPNPWSTEGRPLFQTIGQGWRYGFRRPE